MFADTGNIVLELGAHPLSVIVRLMGAVENATTVVSGRRTLNTGVTFFDTWQMLLACERGPAQCYFSLGGDFADGWAYVVGQDACAMVDLLRNTYILSTKTKFAPPVQDFVDSMRRSRSYFADGFRNITGFAAGLLGFRTTNDVFSVGMRNSVASFYEALSGSAVPPAGIVEGTAVIDACHRVIQSAYTEERRHVER
jgi:predicted dehydrogenase